jgi:hypothetical protein
VVRFGGRPLLSHRVPPGMPRGQATLSRRMASLVAVGVDRSPEHFVFELWVTRSVFGKFGCCLIAGSVVAPYDLAVAVLRGKYGVEGALSRLGNHAYSRCLRAR